MKRFFSFASLIALVVVLAMVTTVTQARLDSESGRKLLFFGRRGPRRDYDRQSVYDRCCVENGGTSDDANCRFSGNSANDRYPNCCCPVREWEWGPLQDRWDAKCDRIANDLNINRVRDRN